MVEQPKSGWRKPLQPQSCFSALNTATGALETAPPSVPCSPGAGVLPRAGGYRSSCSRPPFCIHFGGLWAIKFTGRAGTLRCRHARGAASFIGELHLTPAKQGGEKKKKKKTKNETNCPKQGKGKVEAAICHTHSPERAAEGRHVGKRLGKDASARLSERRTRRVCFVQARGDLAG